MLLNSVFLIRKSDFEGFKKGAEGMGLGYKGMSFEVAGPFPPYNFIE